MSEFFYSPLRKVLYCWYGISFFSFSRSNLYLFHSAPRFRRLLLGFRWWEVPAEDHRVGPAWDWDWFPVSWKIAHSSQGSRDSSPSGSGCKEHPAVTSYGTLHYPLFLKNFIIFCPVWMCYFLNLYLFSQCLAQIPTFLLSEQRHVIKILFYKPRFPLNYLSFRNSRNQK